MRNPLRFWFALTTWIKPRRTCYRCECGRWQGMKFRNVTCKYCRRDVRFYMPDSFPSLSGLVQSTRRRLVVKQNPAIVRVRKEME